MSGTENPACTYLAWLQNEVGAHGKECIDALNRIAKDNFEKKNIIITSTITFVEVMSSTLSEDNERKFRRSFRNQDHIAYDVDPPIAMKARELRDKFSKYKAGKVLTTADAIHLATAAIYKSDELWTLDDGKKGKGLGLLELDGHESLDKIAIKRPHIEQPDLL